MKWVTRGVALGALPFFLLQSLPRAAGVIPDTWIDVAIFPLMLIPTSFGYAIHRYKLMDVDIIFKRGVTYTLATASVVTMIVLAESFWAPAWNGLAHWPALESTIIAALLFSPIKDQFQVWLDKIFYGERYSMRHTLVDFGRDSGLRGSLREHARSNRGPTEPRLFCGSRGSICGEYRGTGTLPSGLRHGSSRRQ